MQPAIAWWMTLWQCWQTFSHWVPKQECVYACACVVETGKADDILVSGVHARTKISWLPAPPGLLWALMPPCLPPCQSPGPHQGGGISPPTTWFCSPRQEENVGRGMPPPSTGKLEPLNEIHVSKITNMDCILHESNHPTAHKVSSIQALFNRVDTHCSTLIAKVKERTHFYQICTLNGYSMDFIRWCITPRAWQPIESTSGTSAWRVLPYMGGIQNCHTHSFSAWG